MTKAVYGMKGHGANVLMTLQQRWDIGSRQLRFVIGARLQGVKVSRIQMR